MTSLDAMKALSGTDSRKIADAMNKEVGDHRDIIGKLRNTAGVDATALGNYSSAVDRLARLTTVARSDNMGELGSTISDNEKGMLRGAVAGLEKDSTQDFKVKLESGDTTVAGPAKTAADVVKTTADTLVRNQGESVWRHSGTGERVGEAIDGSTAKESESRRMTKAEGESIWRDEKTGKPIVDVSAAAVKRAGAEPTGGTAAKPETTTATGTFKDGATTDQVLKNGKVLAEGDKGQGVTDAQSLLKGIKGADGKPKYDLGGFGDKGDGVDGMLGPKTKAAIEQFKKDQGFATDGKGTLNKEVLERMQAVNGASAMDAPVSTAAKPTTAAADTKTVKEGADTRAARLGTSDMAGVASRVKDAFASGSSGRVNELLGQMNSAELASVREQIGTKKFEEMIGGVRKLGTTGYDTDYGEALQASAFGDRKALKEGDVAGFTERLKGADTAPNIFAQGLKAIGLGGAGTNEQQMNSLFDLDNASLKKVDAELRKSYPGGLREFINSNYGGANDSSDKTKDLFMKRFNAAGL